MRAKNTITRKTMEYIIDRKENGTKIEKQIFEGMYTAIITEMSCILEKDDEMKYDLDFTHYTKTKLLNTITKMHITATIDFYAFYEYEALLKEFDIDKVSQDSESVIEVRVHNINEFVAIYKDTEDKFEYRFYRTMSFRVYADCYLKTTDYDTFEKEGYHCSAFIVYDKEPTIEQKLQMVSQYNYKTEAEFELVSIARQLMIRAIAKASEICRFNHQLSNVERQELLRQGIDLVFDYGNGDVVLPDGYHTQFLDIFEKDLVYRSHKYRMKVSIIEHMFAMLFTRYWDIENHFLEDAILTNDFTKYDCTKLKYTYVTKDVMKLNKYKRMVEGVLIWSFKTGQIVEAVEVDDAVHVITENEIYTYTYEQAEKTAKFLLG